MMSEKARTIIFRYGLSEDFVRRLGVKLRKELKYTIPLYQCSDEGVCEWHDTMMDNRRRLLGKEGLHELCK